MLLFLFLRFLFVTNYFFGKTNCAIFRGFLCSNIIERLEQIMSPKIPKYNCELCGIKTNNKKDYNKHLLTLKHKNRTNLGILEQNIPTCTYNCEYCGKKYKARNSLWYHKKNCDINKHTSNIVITDDKILTNDSNIVITDDKILTNNDDIQTLSNLIVEMVKSNNEIQKQVLDVCKNIQPNISNSNNNNNTFNLQFFLNEQCKDAMNITDFINSVTLSLSDLENMGTSGYVNGISSIIIKELRGLDITKRPVHCSDAKRETLYIKDEDKWEKECPENTKMKTAIRTVEKKNIKLISEWTDKHPKFTNSTTRENDEYLQILIETMGGKGDYEKNKNKVIKNIAKEVVIDK